MSQSETRSVAAGEPPELPFFGSESPPAMPPRDAVTPLIGATGDEPTAPQTPLPRPLPDIPGYEILREVDRGGMGIVYEARDRRLKRTVALKLVPPFGRDADAVRRRFDREVGLLGGLDHPNILRVEHADEWAGCHYFTMRYVPGGTLGQHLPRIRADLRAAVGLVAKVARAVGALHAAGVMHRDLKPSNILLGDGDEPLVADFGLAKGHDDTDSLTPEGAAVGTRMYMSPEQTRGAAGEYAPACDIWALGVILYEVLTGRRPFDDRNVVELYRRIQCESAEACSSANPDVPAALDRVVQRCLAKKPADRYTTADGIADDLERWLRDDLPPPPPEPRRWWVWAAAAAGLAAVVAAGLLVPDRADPAAPTDPPPARSVADRLRAGETVTLIGSTGMPLVPYAPVPGSSERFSDDRDGYATLSSFQYAAVDLVGDPIPLPVRVEAEVAIVDPRGAEPSAAVFVGRQGWAGPAGGGHTQCQLTLREARDFGPDRRLTVTTFAHASVSWWTGRGEPHEYEPGGRLEESRTEVPAKRPPLHWNCLALDYDREAVVAGWMGRELPQRLTAGHAREWAELRLAAPGRAKTSLPNQPALGPGIGLSVYSCSAAFRNVRLVPQRRTP